MSKFVAFLNVFVFMLTAIMIGITKEELVTILDEKLEEKFQRKFDELKQQLITNSLLFRTWLTKLWRLLSSLMLNMMTWSKNKRP